MRKLRNDNMLRGFTTFRRPAFTLAEMIVSMGVLVLMLTLAGQVFNLTVQSTGQATALVQLNQALRSFDRTIREDLRHVFPGESLVMIQGNTVNAYWTADGAEVDGNPAPFDGYPHEIDPDREADSGILKLPRADMLMLFTNRPARSYVNPEIRSNVQQVVYGHAELGKYVADPNWQPGQVPFLFERALGSTGTMFPVPPNQAAVPASSWHLARRAVHLLSTPGLDLVKKGEALDWNTEFANAQKPGLGDHALLQSATDVVINFDYESLVQRDTVPQPTIYYPGQPVLTLTDTWHLPLIFGIRGRPLQPFARSELDPAPPPLYADRLGHYMLPNCASFKVEWTMNPRADFVAGRLDNQREILWIDPGHTEDPVGLPDAAKDDALATIEEAGKAPGNQYLIDWLLQPLLMTDGTRYALADRFRSDVTTLKDPANSDPWEPLTSVLGPDPADHRANTHMFLATRPVRQLNANNTFMEIDPDNVVPDDVFPTALRITIDVYDPQQRLGRPTRHVIIATVGG